MRSVNKFAAARQENLVFEVG